MNVIFLLLSTFLFLFSYEVRAAACTIESPDILNHLKKNTFKIVPRNTYAPVIAEEKARELYQLKCLQKNLSLSEQLNCNALESCTGSLCKVEHQSFGTGFILKDQPYIITAWHVVHPTHEAALIFLERSLSNLEPAVLQQTLEPLRPDFLLFDDTNNLIYDTRSSSESSLYAFWGNPLSSVYHTIGHAKNEIYGYYQNVPDDYVAITLPSAVLKNHSGLKLSSALQKNDFEGQCLFSIGYEYLNEHFVIAGGRNADIKSLLAPISHMSVLMNIPETYDIKTLRSLPVSEILPLMGYSPEQIKETLQKHEISLIQSSIQVMLTAYERTLQDYELRKHPNVLFFDAPTLFGQSGGPIVNVSGEVIGITTNGFIDKSVSTPDGHFKSFGTSGLFIRALDQYLY